MHLEKTARVRMKENGLALREKKPMALGSVWYGATDCHINCDGIGPGKWALSNTTKAV